MFEYEIRGKGSNDIYFIWGYNYEDACRRSNIDPSKFDVLNFEYVD